CDRTGFDDPDVPTCVPLCTPAGDACSGLPIPLDERRRSLWQNTNPEAEPDDWILRNVSLKPYGNAIKGRHLAKRAITAITEGQISTYVPAQFYRTKLDGNFGPVIPLVEVPESDHTVTEQIVFSTETFQMGAKQVHGCTMVTVVSRRAVYMGHFWEVPSWAVEFEFKARVINLISGNGIPFGDSPPLDPSLFNGPHDDTRIYIMHPRRTPTSTSQKPRYPGKLRRLKSMLTGLTGLLPNAPTVLWLYKRLDHDLKQDRLDARNTQRGHAIFQFDPNGRGTGSPGWRLFYEEHVFNDTDPPPNADSANGIPDL
ncbi:hypothetical protein V496_00351, partial [Pseudogymnoascus sp. VKM F-4515 (FW-2607)]